MKKQDIQVGSHYLMRVATKIVVVRVDSINQREGTKYFKGGTSYSCTNLTTGKKCRADSAAKFRDPVPSCDKCGKPFTRFSGKNPGTCLPCQGKPEEGRGLGLDRLPATPAAPEASCAVLGGLADDLNDATGRLLAEALRDTSPEAQAVDRRVDQLVQAGASIKAAAKQAVAEGEQGHPFAAVPTAATSPTSSPDAAAASTAERPASPLSTILRKAVAAAPHSNGGIKPTEEQQAILDLAATMGAGDVLVIEAGAGAGKTSTLKMLEQVLPGNGQYTAFNKALVNESKAKFKKAKCSTTHGLAYRAVGSKYDHRLGGARVRSDVVAAMLGMKDLIIQVRLPEQVEELFEPGKTTPRCLNAGYLASQVLGAIKRFCQSADPELTGGHFKYIDGIDFPCDGARTYDNNNAVREHLLPFAKKAWADLSDVNGTLPFAHDHYVKIWQLNRPVISADYILLDEAQDSAAVFLDIIQQQTAALTILVGDSAQQIYEWRGAVNAMKAYPDAPRRFLSQSFRFGPAIAALANKVLECLEEKTPLRLRGYERIASRIEAVAQPRAILTRTNGAAISHLLQAIEAGRKPFLVGGGSDVISFVEAAQALQQGRSTSHPDLACFGSWKEVQEYVKTDEGEELKLLAKLIDAFGCEVILSALKHMPEEKQADLVISTAHKAKGREWESVKLAADFPTRSKCQDSDLKLLYVALTRAQLVLDVSECPFFTGQDALPFEATLPTLSAETTEGMAKPAPSTPPAPTAFTWSRGKDDKWLVRGPSGRSGQTVEVERKDGSKSKKLLGDVVWDGGEVATYKVK